MEKKNNEIYTNWLATGYEYLVNIKDKIESHV